MNSFPGADVPHSTYIAELWEQDTQCCLQRNLQCNPYYLVVMREEYKYILCGIKQQGMKRYYDNILKVENTALCF
jgi:hypothetical protein